MIKIGKKFLDEEKIKKRTEEKGVPFDHNLEFLVDPFFRRTTQMFDEASAQGMLMNNIQIN